MLHHQPGTHFRRANILNNDDDLSQITVTQTDVMYMPITYYNNIDQQLVTSNNNVTISPNHNYQQYDGYDASNNNIVISSHNYQQPMINDIPHHNYQQIIASNNNDTISNPQQCGALINIPHHNYQQSMSNNTLPLQFYPQYIDQNSLNLSQYNIFPMLNSLGITINSPQINIIILPTINSGIQNQLQQINIHSFQTNNSQTRFQ